MKISEEILDNISSLSKIKIDEIIMPKLISELECSFNLVEEMNYFVGGFLTGTAAEVTPVSEINDYKFKVCNLITNLNDSYQALVRKKTAA